MKKTALCFLLFLSARSLFAAWGAKYDLDALPIVPEGFKVMFVAREPELMHEVCMCFDEKGNLMVAGGAQFRWPMPNTPKDRIKVLFDKDGDGKADEIKIFAEGFNCIQAMAWKGKDLWVCHCPDVTICRDVDGDGSADEFTDVFTGLGPLRHGLHGFNWGPDGKLYMSQGNNTCTKDAPKPWRDLMHVVSDAPEVQSLRKYTKAEWKSHYLTPYNDESEGGILRCDPDGKNLEIFARGMRNPWDIAFDPEFNWIAGDNDDGPEHDRVFRFFHGANMGHRHPWSKSWTGTNFPGVAPSSALFPDANGSAVGVVYYDSPHFPPQYRKGFFMGDSDGEKVYFFRPEWEGAQTKVKLETFIKTKEIGKSALFMPTDVEVGPDGALYVISWGSTYGSKWAPYHGGTLGKKGRDEVATINEGRVFKIWYDKAPLIPRETWFPAKRNKPYAEWTLAELLEDMGHQIPVWRVNAQDEVVKRGLPVVPELMKAITAGDLTTAQETWAIWALGRIAPEDRKLSMSLVLFWDMPPNPKFLNRKIQAIRILAFRKPDGIGADFATLLTNDEPRIRFEAAQALWRLGAKDQVPAMLKAAAVETERTVFYAQWRGLQELLSVDALKALQADPRGGVRRAALLALLETSSLKGEEVLPMMRDKEAATRQAASLWLAKLGKNLPADSLIEFFSDPNPDTRNTALACLSRTKLTPATVAKLTGLHAKASGEERAMLLSALASDPGSLETLWHELDSPDQSVRYAAIGGLGKHESRLPTLAGSLEKASANQRDGAIIALAGYKKLDWPLDAAKLKALAQTYASTDPTARRAVVTLLDKTKDLAKSPVKAEAGELARQASIDPDPDVRRIAAQVCKTLKIEVAQRKQEGVQFAQVVPLIAAGDPARGREIFFRQNTPGCYNCHQLEGKGTAIGPDLSDIGLRADGKNILESILDPSKVIIEGFQPTSVKTKDGMVVTGLIKDDSDEALWLVESTGKRFEIPKKEIASRKSLNVSFMPDNFSELLKAQEVADLVSYMLTLKQPKLKTAAEGDKN